MATDHVDDGPAPPGQRFWLGALGGFSFWLIPLSLWLIKKLVLANPADPMPTIGPYYVLLIAGALLGTIIWSLIGGAWSWTLPAHARWLAWYHGASAPHAILFIIGGSDLLTFGAH